MALGDGRAEFRSLFISDLHLGSYRCNTAALQTFLGAARAQTLYLVGDVIDFWSLRARSSWPAAHVAVLRQLCTIAQSGCRTVVVPGNHDLPLLGLQALSLPGVELHRECVIRTARGERFLIAHGHEQDSMFGSTCAAVQMACGVAERVGDLAIRLGARRSGVRRHRWRPKALAIGGRRDPEMVTRFERAMVAEARRRHVDGVICGHSHVPADRRHDGLRYLNCGDWMSNCTAIGETHSGEIRLFRWVDASSAQAVASLPARIPDIRLVEPLPAAARVWR